MKNRNVLLGIVCLFFISFSMCMSTKEVSAAYEKKVYRINYRDTQWGMEQVGSKQLVPKGFAWLENGIPIKAVELVNDNYYFKFRAGSVWDRGRPRVYDSGYWYKEFGTPWGNFYARADNLYQLIYK
ncbi:hypothetical protein [Carnobacterium maltaromaticum]|uniref:hypothetical protein n=1 Tax=Carnobacterium maltaromaticum TaxID=2751 RepID=UPI0039BDA9E1